MAQLPVSAERSTWPVGVAFLGGLVATRGLIPRSHLQAPQWAARRGSEEAAGEQRPEAALMETGDWAIPGWILSSPRTCVRSPHNHIHQPLLAPLPWHPWREPPNPNSPTTDWSMHFSPLILMPNLIAV